MFAALKGISIGAKLGIAIGVLLLFAVVGYIGYTKGINVSKVEIAKYESKIQGLNAQVAAANAKVDVRVVTQYKDKVRTIDRVVYETRDIIRTRVAEQFTLSKGWVYAYNQSIQGLVINPELAGDKTPSTTTELKALADTIAPNNGVYLANKAQLEALQQAIKEREAANAKINSGK